jgi:Flp pilus assembly protein TadG
MLPLLLTVVGVALDGGVVFDARRDLQNVADAAAHAGSTEIDLARFQQIGDPALDARGAAQVAEAYVADYNASHRPDQRVTLDDVSVPAPDRIVVRVSRDARTAFLRIVGIASVRVTAEAAGTARSGGA